MTAERRARIAALNDQLRLRHSGGRILITSGVKALGPSTIAAVMIAVAAHSDFNDQNDPYDEHDFGAVTVQGRRIFWKIDYYDQSLTGQAVDPADPAVCTRVMTVMLAEEY